MAKNIPSSVVHYTTLDTLSKLLNGALNDGYCTFHLSSLRSMNDPSEGFLIERFFAKSKDRNKKTSLKDYLKGNQPFIFSTSQTDSETVGKGRFPMWLMYGENFHGCMIRFEYKKLQSLCKARHWTFAGCEYKSFKESDIYWKNLKQRPQGWCQELLQRAVFTKYKYWDYEKEWRICIYTSENIKFKANTYGIVPYVEMRMPIGCIDEICLGPKVHVDVVTKTLDELKGLLSEKYPETHFKITTSTIKIR